MGRRIEIELTSTRGDGAWTWRAAGARQPKGELPSALLYEGAKVGDVVKVEAEFHVDGIEVTEVFAPKAKKERTNLLEMKSRPLREDELVSTQRVRRDDRGGGGGRRSDNRSRDNRGRGRPRREGGRERSPQIEAETRPKPKRLRPRREHRDALLATVGEEHRPIVEQVIKDGMPGVRAAIERQNAEAKEAGKPEIDAAPILAIAEKNVSKARLAEWRDRADAALSTVTELDLRDLRSVVVAGNDLARDAESREIADKLKASLDERVEADHTTWLTDLESAVGEGRVVRALRLSSRPVKAGAPLPPELASTLAGQASEALGPDIGQERWATVLDALAFSPVRGAVRPVGVPSDPKSELLDAVKRLADRIPTIAAMFGVDPAQVPRSAKRRRPNRRDGERPKGDGNKGRRDTKAKAKAAPGADSPASTDGAPAPAPTAGATAAPIAEASATGETVVGDTPTTDAATEATTDTTAATPVAEAPVTEAPVTEAPVTEAPVTEAPVTEAPVTEAPVAAEVPTTEESSSTDTPAGAESVAVDAETTNDPTPDNVGNESESVSS